MWNWAWTATVYGVCGIVGWAFIENLSRNLETLSLATDTLVRRGPDESGYWVSEDGAVSLGHRRLSVLELSPAGAQPMTSSSGRFVISFNGEIYNHDDLRRELTANGSVPASGWRGNADTETLLEAIEAWGVEGTLKRVVGMFAFALWDRRAGTLTLARDRFGEKPLYVTRIGDGVAFASELKALESLPGFDTTIDRGALAYFLSHGYVQAPESIYASTGKLLPGSFVVIHEAEAASMPRSGDFLKAQRKFYWRLFDVAMDGINDPFTGTESDAVDELDRVLSRAVRRQQLSDVPLGAFLSGGIDSSAVVALMQAHASGPVKTFTIGFEEGEYDESKFAEQVAAHLGTNHTTVMLSPNDALERVSSLPAIWDEPFADVSQLPTLLLSEVTRRSVTVALSGDGGDELFGGYDRYSWTESAWPKLSRIPGPLRSLTARGIRSISPRSWDRVASILPARYRGALSGDRLHKISALLPAETVSDLYENFLSSWRSDAPVLQGETPYGSEHWSGYPALPTIAESLMYRDAVDYMTDDVLVKVDRAAMAVSLETRAPILDHEVAALAWKLPVHMKRANGVGKLTLRRLVHKYVPSDLVERPKAGFAVPLDEWLRGPMRAWAEAHLETAKLADAGLNVEETRRRWLAHSNGTENHRYYLWNVLTYQAWRAHRGY